MTSTELDRIELQKRTLRVLVVGQVVAAAALSAAVTVGAFVIQDILGQDTPWVVCRARPSPWAQRLCRRFWLEK